MFILLLFLIVTDIIEAQNCPSIYKRFNAWHTYCLPSNSTCDIVKRGVTQNDREIILRTHNEYRSKISNGQEKRAGGMPAAANMLEMEWDEELARIAQKHAERCVFENDCDNCRRVQAFPVGQNIDLITDIQIPTDSPDWKNVVRNWYAEIRVFNKNYVKPYILNKDYERFTQVVWASSWKIGCGWILYKTGKTYSSYTVCNYGPAGNKEGSEMYEVGKTCSTCPKNSCCGSSCNGRITPKYTGLCKVVIPFLPPEGPGPHGGNFVFFCDFFNQPDCAMKFEGKPWTIVRTAGGNWMSIVLKNEQKTNLIFTKKFTTNSQFCAKIVVRSGPILGGQITSGVGITSFQFGNQKKKFEDNFKVMPKANRHDFMPLLYQVALPKNSDVQFSFSFTVPPHSPPQFVEIKEVSIKKGNCD